MKYIKKDTLAKAVVFAGVLIPSVASAYEFEIDDTVINIYGYAKLDMIYDADTDMGYSVNPAIIDVDGRGTDGQLTMHAQQSRLGFSTSAPAGDSYLKINVEGDFYGGSFRLRHAYGEWNGILAGQTWTNFRGMLSEAPVVNFLRRVGSAGARQTQLRYTVDNFSASLEDPNGMGGNELEYNPTYRDMSKSRFPDVVMRYTNRDNKFQYSIATVLRSLEYDSSQAPEHENQNVNDDSVFAWGVNLEAAYTLTPSLTVRAGVIHGTGIGGYVDVNPAGPAYIDTAAGNLESIDVTGFVAGVSYKFGPGAINLVHQSVKADIDDALSRSNYSSQDEAYMSNYVNYIWSPVKKVTFGVEAGLHDRELADGRDGSALRFQTMAMYSF